jgi:predicted nucleotidyltransferase
MMNEVDSKSNNWQQALEIFLDKWRDLDYVEGVLVTGSQVVGTATQNSDVDVHIILSPNIDWRERGNELVNDTLIEYFANPVFFFQQYLDEDYANNSKQNARMFVIGKILFDKNGEVAKLVSQAKTLWNGSLPSQMIYGLMLLSTQYGTSLTVWTTFTVPNSPRLSIVTIFFCKTY